MLLCSLLLVVAVQSQGENLIQNADFESSDAAGLICPGFELAGLSKRQYVGYQDEFATYGVGLNSHAQAGAASGSVAQMVKNLDAKNGKWLRFSFRGRPEVNFDLGKGQLLMKFDFYSKGGTNFLDTAMRRIDREVEKDRKDLEINGNYGKGGAAVWRTYDFEELMPFAEVDAVKVSVEIKDAASKQAKYASFFIDDFALTQNQSSSRQAVDPQTRARSPISTTKKESLVGLGGRWFYLPLATENVVKPLRIDYRNADRLFYDEGVLTAPFAGNMTSTLKPGHYDVQGNLVNQSRVLLDNVVLTFDDSPSFSITTKGIPNHPTARFPDTYGTQGYNPNAIQETSRTYKIWLNPKHNESAFAMTNDNSNGALNMGATGVAINGVIFFNPYDAGMTDAASIMDRCCGHPAPDNQYHYHKYPICVNTMFADRGETHSPIIGFALDGFPVYGPYESNGVMAKDLTENKLNAFNGHSDPVRGWHYHVTPGKFPYILGGYWGTAQFERRGRGGG